VSAGFPGAGLSTEQAPPLSIPVSFFLTAPVAIGVAGLWLLVGAPPLHSRWLPGTLVVTHLGTLGFLAAVMFGALYQMTPVVAGSPVPLPRAAHLVHASLVLGVSALVGGFATGSGPALWLGATALALAVVAFLVPVGIALARAPTRGETVAGMRLAVVALLATVVFGVLMTIPRTGTPLPFATTELFTAHVSLGLVAWVGGLISSVSWQVVPMFYLTPEIPRWARRLTLGCVALVVVAPLALLVDGRPAWLLPALAAPGALAVWALHPALVLVALRRRKRRRVDGSKGFWQIGLACAPLALALATAATFSDEPRWAVAFGWVAVWGWAGAIVIGMLTRIVPFLVWFHRFSALVGKVEVPPMNRMIPQGWIGAARWLHVATLLAGLTAVVVDAAWTSGLLGALLVASGTAVAASLVRVLRLRPGR